MTTKIKSNRLIYAAEFVFIALLFYCLPAVGDDVANAKSPSLQTWAGIYCTVHHAFFTWSSRIFLNPMLYALTTQLPKWVFALITGLLIVTIVDAVNQHLNPAQEPRLTLSIALIPLLFPLIELDTAGYIATTVTYLWPVGILALALTLTARLKAARSIPVKSTLSVLIGLLWLLAANNEQLCVILVIMYSYYLIHQFKTRHRATLASWLPSLPLLIDLLLFLLAPGNGHRTKLETAHWYPQFGQLSLIDKFNLGLTTTIQHYFFGLSLVLIFFSIVLWLVNFDTHRKLGALPLLMAGATTAIAVIAPKYATTFNPTYGKTVIVTWLIGIAYLSIVCYLVHDAELNLLLIAGLLARIMLGFSPTVYASATRTFVFCGLIFLYITTKLLINYLAQQPKIINLALEIIIALVIFNAAINAAFLLQLDPNNFMQVPLNFWTVVPHR